jgi:hypothetical protein
MSRLLDPDQFIETVIPELTARWKAKCFCHNPSFAKLVSFNFTDYGISPTALKDSELIIDHLVLKHFEELPWDDNAPNRIRCPQCGELYVLEVNQYSINMECAWLRSLRPLPRAISAEYIVGFHYNAAGVKDLPKITDFRQASSILGFMERISAYD